MYMHVGGGGRSGEGASAEMHFFCIKHLIFNKDPVLIIPIGFPQDAAAIPPYNVYI